MLERTKADLDKIYSILISKPHNEHYLNRYFSFIKKYYYFNNYLSEYDKYDAHHICPKALDLFPEYSSFKKFPWNEIKLSYRQHFICHLLLWKAYPNHKSQTSSFWMMSNHSGIRITNRIYENLRCDFIKRISSRKSINKGKTNAWIGGDLIKIDKNDPRWLSGEAIPQFKNRVMAIDKNNNYIRVSKDDPRWLSGELIGQTKGKCSALNSRGDIVRVSKDDPRWLSGELIGNNREKIHINNGIKNKRIDKNLPIPEGWVKGRIIRYGNYFWITNGLDNIMINGAIPEGWVKGRTKTWRSRSSNIKSP